MHLLVILPENLNRSDDGFPSLSRPRRLAQHRPDIKKTYRGRRHPPHPVHLFHYFITCHNQVYSQSSSGRGMLGFSSPKHEGQRHHDRRLLSDDGSPSPTHREPSTYLCQDGQQPPRQIPLSRLQAKMGMSSHGDHKPTMGLNDDDGGGVN